MSRAKGWIAGVVVALIAVGLALGYRRYYPPPRPFQNILLIGWDGCFVEDVRMLMDDGKLPNLARLVREGRMIDTYITTSKTETKPGWAEILTGYGPDVTGVYDNRVRYQPIPEGLTIFERLKEHFGNDGIRTVFLAGKLQNLGVRGPHKVLVGGGRKVWHDETLWQPGDEKGGEVVEHAGEPYFLAQKRCDVLKNGLGDAEFVGKAAVEALRECGAQRFFMFVHFWEPDESGHDYGEGTDQYLQAIEKNDEWLGRIMTALTELGLYDKTLIYVTTDHGFDRGHQSHIFAPRTWVVTNDNVPLVRKGDRKDMAPTLMQRFGIDIGRLQPPLQGRSLIP